VLSLGNVNDFAHFFHHKAGETIESDEYLGYKNINDLMPSSNCQVIEVSSHGVALTRDTFTDLNLWLDVCKVLNVISKCFEMWEK